jgi:hypothetical protein
LPPSIAQSVNFKARHYANAPRLRTLEFLIQLTARRHAQGAYKLLEVDSAILVVIKDFENIFSKFVRVSEWEELLVDLAEFCLIELTCGAVP